MLLTREEIRQDKSFGLLTDAILERDQPRTTDLFHRMIARDGRSILFSRVDSSVDDLMLVENFR